MGKTMPAIHGADHLPWGPDPITGLTIGYTPPQMCWVTGGNPSSGGSPTSPTTVNTGIQDRFDSLRTVDEFPALWAAKKDNTPVGGGSIFSFDSDWIYMPTGTFDIQIAVRWLNWSGTISESHAWLEPTCETTTDNVSWSDAGPYVLRDGGAFGEFVNPFSTITQDDTFAQPMLDGQLGIRTMRVVFNVGLSGAIRGRLGLSLLNDPAFMYHGSTIISTEVYIVRCLPSPLTA